MIYICHTVLFRTHLAVDMLTHVCASTEKARDLYILIKTAFVRRQQRFFFFMVRVTVDSEEITVWTEPTIIVTLTRRR